MVGRQQITDVRSSAEGRPGTLEPRLDMRAGTIIVVVWLVTRAALACVYLPVTTLDSETYLQLAAQLGHLDFSDYIGQRTPGYPLLLMAVGSHFTMLWFLQACLSLVAALLMFRIVRGSGGTSGLAIGVALIYLLALNTIFYEAAVLTETLSAFLLVLVSYLFLRAVRVGMTLRSSAGIGLAVALLALTRPAYVFMVPLLGLLMCFARGRHRLAQVVVFLVVAGLPVGGWMAFNKAQIGHFSLTSLLGYNLSNHTGAFMEKAADEHALYRDIYLKHREIKMQASGSHPMTVFWAREELKQASGLGEVELSARFQRISGELIAQYPGLYLSSVVKAWASFWAVPRFGQDDVLGPPAVKNWLDGIGNIQHALLRLLNVVFLLSSLLMVFCVFRRRRSGLGEFLPPAFMATVVLATSVVQALAEYGENPRYFIPSQPLVIACTAMALAAFVHSFRGQRSFRRSLGRDTV
jgi:4-amino-4-deoxy-L-arabinose transferase-like glycosyltransferase